MRIYFESLLFWKVFGGMGIRRDLNPHKPDSQSGVLPVMLLTPSRLGAI